MAIAASTIDLIPLAVHPLAGIVERDRLFD
jgi:hypothetical protein